MWKQNIVKRKFIGIPILLIYINLIIILWPELYDEATILNLVTMLLLCVFLAGDILFRPLWVGEEKDQFKKSTLVIFLLFFFIPFLLYIPYAEYQIFLRQFIQYPIALAMAIFGNLVLLCGGILMIWSRILLGPYGTPRIVIKDHHQLITNGIYRYIRHPLYLGYILFLFGYTFAFGGLLSSCFVVLFMLPLTMSRIDLEEKLLLTNLGEEYKSYIKRTKRLIPRIY
ncbi:MAG: isoprenylcysteine carboxylmethyltransferase family protein [Candidatus Heimdallarchaeota archaeon]|nr:isoprenylcysteine carboxylmethyltransferase family protein [Candidatus Heimdallarchaeota archaeon]